MVFLDGRLYQQAGRRRHVAPAFLSGMALWQCFIPSAMMLELLKALQAPGGGRRLLH